MNLVKRLLVCESMLARLDDALARADEELASANTLEDHIQKRLTDLVAEQKRVEQQLADLKPIDLPTTGINEPTRTPHAFDAGSVLRELRVAQEQLVRSLRFHRPSAEVITVNFDRARHKSPGSLFPAKRTFAPPVPCGVA